MEKLENCPICGQMVFSHYKTCIDFTVSKEQFEIVNCTACSFKFTNPRPNQSEIGKYYKSPEYISHTNSRKGLFNSLYQIIRKNAIKSKLNLCEITSKQPGNLIDIGCGTGEFASEAKKRGWNVIGIEPGEEARKAAINNYGLDVRSEDHIDHITVNTIDKITMWHVLEHVHHLNQRIDQIYTLLKPGGKCYIAVPNYTSKDAHTYGKDWAAYDVPRHLYHFSPETVKRLFKKHHLNFLSSEKMPFDSYYVSMLSEKNRGNGLYILKGAWNGLKSNLHTKGDPERYSSVIYIFQKPISSI